MTTILSDGGSEPSPSYSPSVTTTVTATRTETEYYPNDYTGEDISAEAGYYEDDTCGINVIPLIILIVITAASAFALYKYEKK